MTNADRIRNMTDEELAKQIEIFIENAFAFHLPTELFSALDLSQEKAVHLNWLKGEYRDFNSF